MNLETLLADRLAPAFEAVAGVPVDPVVRVSQHADLQSGAALALARRLGRPPGDIAAEVAAKAALDGLASIAVSGPGFLNLTIDDDVIVAATREAPHVPVVRQPKRVVIDYSGPNAAKEMHVGHLRSTIIGDALARIFERAGHDVIRVNHLGDWGTQFGMLIEHLAGETTGDHSLGDLTDFYRRARVRFDNDEEFRTRSRLRVVALQGGDPRSRELWRRLVGQSETAFMDVYARLGVTLAPGDFVGESFYQDRLASVVDELTEKGLLTESNGALCAFPPGFTGRDGDPLPLIVRKSDGGFGYAATDLAALRHRVRDLGAGLLLYVVGTPQQTHFRMVYAVARAAGWLPDGVVAEHVGFGSVLGADGKMLKTRAGGTIKLAGLLDEAVARASSPAVGIGAIKYADLAGDRRSDYVFDWDRMLATTGDTGPYLQYAYTRIRSIFTRTDERPGAVVLTDPSERRLALEILGFEPAMTAAMDHREPHRLAGYLHGLAVAFSAFYERCPVLRADAPVRASRLALADRTARTLALGLDLLGIEVPDVM
nr:arginine--tRNA ligase [uncultured Actinoplanes sp.]